MMGGGPVGGSRGGQGGFAPRRGECELDAPLSTESLLLDALRLIDSSDELDLNNSNLSRSSSLKQNNHCIGGQFSVNSRVCGTT